MGKFWGVGVIEMYYLLMVVMIKYMNLSKVTL